MRRPLLALVLLAGAAAAARLALVSLDPGPPDLVVIVLDTVRKDHLSLYGYDRPTTPRLEAWARSARVYDEARSVSSWTLPSHASLFTGRLPSDHGAHGAPPGGPTAHPLPEGTPTLAGALGAAGYRTEGLVANRAFLHRGWGLAQGFDRWRCHGLLGDGQNLPYVPGQRITDAAIEVLAERDPDQPLFLFLNYMDAHAPWREGAADPEVPSDLLPPRGAFQQIAEEVMTGQRDLPEELRRTWVDAYDAELRTLDDAVGRLLEALPGLGIDEDDLVVILSDHGEYLGEHDLVTHSKDLHEEVLAVPLLVRGRGVAPGRDDTPVQPMDVTRWLLEAAGADPLPEMTPPSEAQVAELHWTRQKDLDTPELRARFDRVLAARVEEGRKVVVGTDGTLRATDVRGAEPVVLERPPPWAEDLAADVEQLLDEEAGGGGPVGEVRPEGVDVEALRALGYVE